MARKHETNKLLKKDSPEYAKAMLRDPDALVAEATRRECDPYLLRMSLDLIARESLTAS